MNFLEVRKHIQPAADDGCTNKTNLQASAQAVDHSGDFPTIVQHLHLEKHPPVADIIIIYN